MRDRPEIPPSQTLLGRYRKFSFYLFYHSVAACVLADLGCYHEHLVIAGGTDIFQHLGCFLTRKNDKIAMVTVVNNSQTPLSLEFSSTARAQIIPKSRKEFNLKPLSVEIYKVDTDSTLTVNA